MKNILFLSFMVTVLLLTACNQAKKENNTASTNTNTQQPTTTPVAVNQTDVDNGLIAEYLKKNNLNAKTTPSGVYYIVEKEGTGPNPTLKDKVEVNYRGTLLDGTEFDSSYGRGQSITFPLGSVVKGWQDGIPMFKAGGKGKLVIPSELAYGKRSMGDKIPANSVLVFDIELIKVAPMDGAQQ
ncbi:MAG: FKBP-type peptidyl-prolyl cis-trans isomerase [Chitinophagales bacterium]|nr:FKBP-type peptidyl-prolyl cis-trans isomerase [Chitinophagales bacterium]MCC7056317.1 FKBP-type peptidyl-prolyl cis-trans isomerase [Chitinophagales bacterium]MDA0198888.1 FKBP-type peptidyl-prolyl cis-trans isomerase [Bacteroidota bacterium]